MRLALDSSFSSVAVYGGRKGRVKFCCSYPRFVHWFMTVASRNVNVIGDWVAQFAGPDRLAVHRISDLEMERISLRLLREREAIPQLIEPGQE